MAKKSRTAEYNELRRQRAEKVQELIGRVTELKTIDGGKTA